MQALRVERRAWQSTDKKGQPMAALYLSLVMMASYAIKPSAAHAAVLETTSLSRKGMDRCVPASRNNSLLP
jgi:hypothetical protein